MIDIRQPNITAKDPTQQLLQMRSYMYQLSQQLQWAFNSIETGGAASTVLYAQSNKKAASEESNPQKSFSEIKSLIIKSADIVDSYYEEINRRLEGVYVAQSEFGTYTEQTALDIQENSKGITQLYTDVQEISDTVDDLYNSVIDSSAYIKTGLLYEEDETGIPVYGLEIGQTNTVDGETVFDKFARFSSDRLSFFDSNDTEVAYISDYKLYITNAEITGSLRIVNRFKIYYANGLAFQWIGGDS